LRAIVPARYREGVRRIAAVLLVLTLGACAHGPTITPRAEKPQFQLDWQVMKRERGAAVRGQLFNPYGLPARDIHLLIEGLDGTGAVVNRTTHAVLQIVRSREKATFDVPVADGAERYRVSVVTFDLILPRGGR
jgi:hypothetical protein